MVVVLFVDLIIIIIISIDAGFFTFCYYCVKLTLLNEKLHILFLCVIFPIYHKLMDELSFAHNVPNVFWEHGTTSLNKYSRLTIALSFLLSVWLFDLFAKVNKTQ